MNSRRVARVAETLREVVSTTVLFELRDPRVKNVTITRVEVSSDLQNAKVYVSVMGDEKRQRLSIHGLNSARGFIQSKIGDRIKSRYTPVLKFVLDDGIKKSFEATRILNEVLPGPETEEPLDTELEDGTDNSDDDAAEENSAFVDDQ